MRFIRYIDQLLARGVMVFVRVYQWVLSPWMGRSCRFHPTCSAYALEALQKHGAFYGSILTIKRLCKCHPWGSSGVDPVPEIKKTKR